MRKVVARVADLPHGTTRKFHLNCAGRSVEGFLVAYAGGVFAYVNRCRHLPMSMDWVENHFFSEDKRYLICATHGATYEPTTGECIWGPCFGAFLEAVPIEIIGGEVFAFCPEEKEAPSTLNR
jgi:nitrite reductase/ring-hydroxylating ferredoxin subunit